MALKKKNNTLELVDLPRGKKLVVNGCLPSSISQMNQWRGTMQDWSDIGIDYQETCFCNKNELNQGSHLSANQNWHLLQFNVKNTYLHGDLEEGVYMVTPPRFCMSQVEGKVCKLKKTLYGLKQLPRAWFERF